MEPRFAGIARRTSVRAVLATPAHDDALRWLDVVRNELSVDVRCASTVAHARDVVLDWIVEVAIVGTGFADGSCWDAVRALKLVRPDLPIIVVAHLNPAARRNAHALGAAEIVTPDTVTRLGAAIKTAIDSSRFLPPSRA